MAEGTPGAGGWTRGGTQGKELGQSDPWGRTRRRPYSRSKRWRRFAGSLAAASFRDAPGVREAWLRRRDHCLCRRQPCIVRRRRGRGGKGGLRGRRTKSMVADDASLSRRGVEELDARGEEEVGSCRATDTRGARFGSLSRTCHLRPGLKIHAPRGCGRAEESSHRRPGPCSWHLAAVGGRAS